jgi:hypothetical protein
METSVTPEYRYWLEEGRDRSVGRCDIWIEFRSKSRKRAALLVIENKINAPEGDGQPKFATKDELCSAAMRELNVSKSSFNFAWIDAIETSRRTDWYEPLRRRTHTKN